MLRHTLLLYIMKFEKAKLLFLLSNHKKQDKIKEQTITLNCLQASERREKPICL